MLRQEGGDEILPAVVLTATTANRKVSVTIMWHARGRHKTVFLRQGMV